MPENQLTKEDEDNLISLINTGEPTKSPDAPAGDGSAAQTITTDVPDGGDTPDDDFKSWKEAFEFGDDVKNKEDAINVIKSWREKYSQPAQPATNIGIDIDPDLVKQNSFFKATGVKDLGLYSRLTSSNLSEMSALDKLLIKEEMEFIKNFGNAMPENVRAKMAERLKLQYKQNEPVDGEDPIDPADKQLGEFEMRKAAATASSELENIISQINSAVPDPAKAQEAEKARVEQWNPLLKNFYDDVSKSKYEVSLKEDFGIGKDEFKVDYQIPKEDYTRYLSEFYKYVESNRGLAITPESDKMLQNYIRNRAFAEHQDKILSVAVKLAVEQANKHAVVKGSNVGPVNKDIKNPDVTVTKQSLEDAAVQAINYNQN